MWRRRQGAYSNEYLLIAVGAIIFAAVVIGIGFLVFARMGVWQFIEAITTTR